MECQKDAKRGFDHGTFIPLVLAFPKADIPVVQLSLAASLDPQVGLHACPGSPRLMAVDAGCQPAPIGSCRWWPAWIHRRAQ